MREWSYRAPGATAIRGVRGAFGWIGGWPHALHAYQPKERASPAIRDGFDADPLSRVVENHHLLVVHRAHGGDLKGSSRLIGHFFFVPRSGGVSGDEWTADLLERELNAALWGNEFRFLATFWVKEGVRYRIGPIAHDRYQGVEAVDGPAGKVVTRFDQYAYFEPQGLFLQVQMEIPSDRWRDYLVLVSDEPIKAGRLHRETAHA